MEMMMLRRSMAKAAFAAILMLPGLAQARDACGGDNLLPSIEAARPGAVAAMRAAAAAQPNSEGLFWRIEAPGRAPSFLFGALHGAASEGVVLPPSARDAIRSARVVYAEMTEDEQARMQQAIADDIELIVDRRGGTLDAALTPALRETARRVLPDYGLTYAQANVLRPWFIQIALATPPCAAAAMAAGEQVLDHAILDEARAAGLPVRGMETWRAALAFFLNQPEDEARDGVALAVATAAEAEDMRKTMADLWRAEETMMIWELTRDLYAGIVGPAEADAAMRQTWDDLVVARNDGFLAATADDLAAGGAFIAAGALHLPGHGGMVESLRAMGYAVTRVPLR